MEFAIYSEDFERLFLKSSINFFLKFLKELQKEKRKKIFIKKTPLKDYISKEDYIVISFSFDKPLTWAPTFILSGVKKTIYMSNAFVVSSVKRSYSGDLYLPLLVFYNLVLYLIKHKYKKLELTDVNNGSYDNVIVNDEKDINKFFDMLTDDSFLKLDKRIHKKGSDLIQYLKVPYDDAKKMKGFPKKWIVNFKDK